ncbi:hypothetical protein ABFT23_02280 [Nocardioides sp. C4-1]|uniref:hypothetical protein n=1 Tax=Nocardioides sp. C4-1 TaxID=3151851 RepID=UPI003264862A
MTASEPFDDHRDYPLAPAFAARLVGLGLVVIAVAVLVYTGAALVFSWPATGVVAVAAVGLCAVVVAAWWLQARRYVVRFTAEGYRVRFVRGVGVARGRWDDVEEAVAASPHDIDCVVLRRRDGSTTTIPVVMLAVDRERFADDVRARLEAVGRRG